MAHEAAHHVQKKLNQGLDDARRRTTEDNMKRWGKAVSEGTADFLAALYEKSLGRPDSDAYVILEDVVKPSRPELIRDLRIPASFDDWTTATTGDPDHQNGRIIANVFYRMKEAGVTETQLSAIIGDLISTIVITPTFDDADFKAALDHVVAGDLQAILDAVWTDMNGSVGGSGAGGTGDPGAPNPLSHLRLTHLYCDGATSYDALAWNGSSGASFYHSVGIPDTLVPIWPEGTTTGTYLPVYTSVGGTWYIAACNGQGCSSYVYIHEPAVCGG